MKFLKTIGTQELPAATTKTTLLISAKRPETDRRKETVPCPKSVLYRAADRNIICHKGQLHKELIGNT